MLRDITLGQYFPGNSPVHRLDPRMKLILSIVYIVTVFACKTLPSFAAAALLTVVLIALSRISVVTILKSMKPVLFILVFTVIANIFWTTGDAPLLEFGFIKIYKEGLIYAGLMALRIVCLILSTFVLLTYTTSPVALTDAIERLLSPLAKIGLPVHEFSMMMTIALRFIPTLLEETEKIMNAQRARGADFSTGTLKQRAKALVPVLIPLFISAFRRAEELAIAMECRCYTGGEGRTRMNVLHSSYRDFFGLVAAILLCLAVVLINKFAPGYSISM